MSVKATRRGFLRAAVGTAGVSAAFVSSPVHASTLYSIGLSQYSLRQLFQNGSLSVFDYPAFARDTFGIRDIDVWEGGIPSDRREDPAFYSQLRRRAEKADSNLFLLMAGTIDGRDTSAEAVKAQAAVFAKPIDNAALLNCKYVRIFLRAAGGEQGDALRSMSEVLAPIVDYAGQKDIVLAVEPGASEWAKQGPWLAALAEEINRPHFRLMPDFGKMKDHDPYGGTAAMMPYTAVVSAKSHNFDAEGNEVDLDYRRLMKTVVDSGFRGIVAIEYEGKELGPVEGVRATQALLEKLRAELQAEV